MSPQEEQRLKAQLIRCVECEELFAWSVAEQEHYAANQMHPPKRCHKHRDNRTRKSFYVPGRRGKAWKP